MNKYDSLIENLHINLPTSESTNYFIKSFESYLKGSVLLELLLRSYPFLKDLKIDDVKQNFQRIRTDLISRKKVKIYTPITISNELTMYLYKVLCKFAKSSIVIEPFHDSSIVAGIKFNLDGKIYNLTLENINNLKQSKN